MYGNIGPYKLIGILGRGGMGVVYKGYETSLNRYVAIKVLADAMAHDEDVKQRFLREARSMAALNDPHIIQIYFIGDNDGQTYFTMEYVDGESLGSLLRRKGKLTPEQATKIVNQAALGLSAAHDKGVIHRDIKPGNLMISSRGVVKIADFGIALQAHDLTNKLTSTGEFVGTPGYLSPEVCQGMKVDERSDIFALGIVLFECLVGRVPFTDASPLGLMLEVVKEEIPDVCALNSDVDKNLAALLSKMVSKDPAHRFQSCAELAQALGEHPLVTQTGPLVIEAQNPKLAPILRVPLGNDAPVARAATSFSASRSTRVATTIKAPRRAASAAPLIGAAICAVLLVLAGLAWRQFPAWASLVRGAPPLESAAASSPPANKQAVATNAQGSLDLASGSGSVSHASETTEAQASADPELLSGMPPGDAPDNLFDAELDPSPDSIDPFGWETAPSRGPFYAPMVYAPRPESFAATPWRLGIGLHIGVGFLATRIVAPGPTWFGPPLLVRPAFSAPAGTLTGTGAAIVSSSPVASRPFAPNVAPHVSAASASAAPSASTNVLPARAVPSTTHDRVFSQPPRPNNSEGVRRPSAMLGARAAFNRKAARAARAGDNSELVSGPHATARASTPANGKTMPNVGKKPFVEHPRRRGRGRE